MNSIAIILVVCYIYQQLNKEVIMKKVFLLTPMLIITLALSVGLTACSGNEAEQAAKEDDKATAEVNEDKAAEQKPAEDTDVPAEAKDDSKLIVATEAGFAPYEYIGDDGEIVGVDIDIAQAIADKLGKELVIKNMSFDGALMDVSNGKVDMVAAGVSVTDERKEVMDFSEPYYTSYQVLMVNSENPAFEKTTLENLNGKIVGAQQGTIGDFWITDETDAEVKRYTELAVAAMDLKQGKIDAIILGNVVAKEMIAANGGGMKIAEGDPILNDDTALALPKDSDEDFKNTVNEVINELKESGKIDEFFNNHKTSEE